MFNLKFTIEVVLKILFKIQSQSHFDDLPQNQNKTEYLGSNTTIVKGLFQIGVTGCIKY